MSTSTPTSTPTRTSDRRRPKALREAKRIADAAQGKAVRYVNLWLEGTGTQTFGDAVVKSEFQVRYTMPRTSGLFVSNVTLWLTDEEWAEYEAWAEQQEA